MCFECQRDKKLFLDILKSEKIRKPSHNQIAEIILDYIRCWEKEKKDEKFKEFHNITEKDLYPKGHEQSEADLSQGMTQEVPK